MFFAYFDESGDTGFVRSPTATFALSCMLIDDRDWLPALDQTIAFRRYLRDMFHIRPRAELKAAWLIHNKGDIRESGLTYPARLAAYKAAMRRFSHVPSAFGGQALGRNAENIVEDSSDRSSRESFFIQLADLNAYAACRKVFPASTFGADIWDELGSSRVLEVNALRGGPPGIVVWPT